MDEMIGAGDQSFMDKAQKRITELLEEARILVLASHNVSIIERFCTKAIWLGKGRIEMLGPVPAVLAATLARRFATVTKKSASTRA